MTLSRAAETPDVSERLQQQKKYLIVLANREALIESEGMDPDILTELNTQVSDILKISERRLRKLIAEINEDANEEAMQHLDKKINEALVKLTDDEAEKMSQVYDNSIAAVHYQNSLKQEMLETPKEELIVKADNPPIAQASTEPTPQTEQSSNTSHHWGAFFTQTTQAVVKATIDATQALATPAVAPAAKNELSAEALRLKAQFNKRTTLFAPENKPEPTLNISQDEKAAEDEAIPVKIARRRVRRVQTAEFQTTPKQNSK